MDILYEDNHIIAVNKHVGEIIQGDISGDKCLLDDVKDYIKLRDNKPGNVYLGLIHRVDRPVGGVVLFAKTSKCLSRMNAILREQSTFHIHEEETNGTMSSQPAAFLKKYWAIVEHTPNPLQGLLCHYLFKNEKQNKTYVTDKKKGKYAVLYYKTISIGERYSLVEIELMTGRHHQIRCQMAHIGCPIKGDLKYGAKRSNPDGGICLLAREIHFEHPVSHLPIHIVAPCPQDGLWQKLVDNQQTNIKISIS